MGIDAEMMGTSSDGESKASRCARLMRREVEIEHILEDNLKDGHPVSIETAAAMAVHRERDEAAREKRRSHRTAFVLSWIGSRVARWISSRRKKDGG